MALSANDIILIEKHLNGHLTDKEKVMFTEKEQLVPDFAEEIELQKNMIAAIQLEDKRLLKAALKKEAQKIILPSASRKNITWYYGIAATLLLVMASTFVLLPSKSSLFNAYYTPFPENPVTRSENGSMDDYKLAMQQYSIGSYEQALATFLTINNSKNQDEISLYVGNCYLSMRQPQMSVGYLQIAVNSTNKQIKLQGEWYIALAYIGLGNKPQAVKQLKTIATSESPYRGKAKVLLQKLTWVI